MSLGHSHGASSSPGSHGHSHGVTTGKGLLISLFLTSLFVVAEGTAGYLSHSLSLWSDAGHNLTDALALGLSYYAVWIAKKPADDKRSFGYHRAGVLAALFNSLSLVLIAFIIFYEGVQRFYAQESVQSTPMIVVASIAIVLNLILGLGLRDEAQHDLNIRSAYLHLLGDAFSALGVVVAGVIIHFTGSKIADPIASLLIGSLILYSSWGILKQSVHVLLEGTPSELSPQEIETEIKQIAGVLGVHHLHIWTVASGFYACSCHVRVADQSIAEAKHLVNEVAHRLEHEFGIEHATIQLEAEDCETGDCSSE